MNSAHPYPKYSMYAYRQINDKVVDVFTPYCNAILVNAGKIEILKGPYSKPRKEVFIEELSWLENFRHLFPTTPLVIYEEGVELGKIPVVFRFMPDMDVVKCECLDINYFMSVYYGER